MRTINLPNTATDVFLNDAVAWLYERLPDVSRKTREPYSNEYTTQVKQHQAAFNSDKGR